MEAHIIIDEIPIPQSRPRVTRFGTFDLQRDKKNWIKLQIKEQVTQILEGPLRLHIAFYMPIPKSTSKKKSKQMLYGDICHIKRPDIDNLIKLYLDCLNEIAFKDDSQIYSLEAVKQYSDKPRTEIIIKEAGDVINERMHIS